MTYKGHIHNGVVVLDEPADIVEGAHVRIELLEETVSDDLHHEIKRFTGVLPSDIDVRMEYAKGLDGLDLESMLALVTPENVHHEIDTGTSVGNEAW